MLEPHCRVCGLDQGEPIWGVDGASPTFGICDCCGCEFGNQDSLPTATRAYREKWLASGGEFHDAKRKPATWNRDAQLRVVPHFLTRIFDGRPGDGRQTLELRDNPRVGDDGGTIVEFACESGSTWRASLPSGLTSLVRVLVMPGAPTRAVVLSSGTVCVVDTEARRIVEQFGCTICEAVVTPLEDAIIFADDLTVLRYDTPGEVRWQSPRISWDGIKDIRVNEMSVHGLAYDVLEDRWEPFELDLYDGRVLAGMSFG